MEGDKTARLRAYRYVAYSLSGFAVVSVVAVCFSLPIVFSYVRTMKTSLERDIQYCRHTSRGIHEEMNRMNYEFGSETPQNRSARNSGYSTGPSNYGVGGYGQTGYTGGSQSYGGSTQSCCQPGSAGPAGRPGAPGRPGRPGANGMPGASGRSSGGACHPPAPPAPCKPCPASLHRAKAAVLLLKALQDHLEARDHLDLPDSQDKAELELLDQRDHLEHLECPDQTETPELLDSLETPVERASAVSARLTAPTTVVCSSRMER